MRRVILRHTHRSGEPVPLTFGLGDILAALGPRAWQSDWRGANLLYTSTDDRAIPVLDRAATGAFVPGEELLAEQTRLAQLIDGDLEGYAGNERWVIVRAVDGARWEVASHDPSVITAITQRFSVINGAEMDIE